MQHAVSLLVPPSQHSVAEKAIAAIEWMLTQAKVTPEPGGGLTWSIELDGYSYEMTVDRDGNVRATASERQSKAPLLLPSPWSSLWLRSSAERP